MSITWHHAGCAFHNCENADTEACPDCAPGRLDEYAEHGCSSTPAAIRESERARCVEELKTALSEAIGPEQRGLRVAIETLITRSKLAQEVAQTSSKVANAK